MHSLPSGSAADCGDQTLVPLVAAASGKPGLHHGVTARHEQDYSKARVAGQCSQRRLHDIGVLRPGHNHIDLIRSDCVDKCGNRLPPREYDDVRLAGQYGFDKIALKMRQARGHDSN